MLKPICRPFTAASLRGCRPAITRRQLAYSQPPLQRQRRPRTLLLLASGGLVGAGLLTWTESGQTTVGAVQRSTRVVVTLWRCISDYRQTLRKKETLDSEAYSEELKACHKRCAELTLAAMEKNGSVFIKLGQHLTSLNYLLPSEWCDTFIPLQDQCPVSTYESIRAMVEKDTGMAFDDLFSEFEEQPLGAASLAQVHRAVDKNTGQTVAVKVQHPVLDHWAPLDLALTRFTFRSLARQFPEYDLTWLSNEMQLSLPQELDFALEGKNAMEAKQYFAPKKKLLLHIPNVLWSRRRILVMEYVTGKRPDDLEYLDQHGISRDEVAAILARIFNTMIFAKGAPLHCDPHGGNIAIRVNPDRNYPRNFDVILYDHGLYRHIPADLQRNYAKLWLAVLESNEADMRKYAKETAGITDEQFPLFASAITGRDYRVVTSDVTSTPRSVEEKQAITDALGDGMLQELVRLLGQVPRIILLILKTNDLTRSLDTNLHTRQGPMRSFLILARYAAQTVYDEQLDILVGQGSSIWPSNVLHLFSAWTKFTRIRLKLQIYEWYLYVRGLAGFDNSMPGFGGQA